MYESISGQIPALGMAEYIRYSLLLGMPAL